MMSSFWSKPNCFRQGQLIILAKERWNKVKGGASGKVSLLSWRNGLFLFLGFLQGRRAGEIWNCFCHLVIIRKIRLRKAATYKGGLSQENIKGPEPWSCCTWNGATLRVLMSSSKCPYCYCYLNQGFLFLAKESILADTIFHSLGKSPLHLTKNLFLRLPKALNSI